MPYVMSSQLKAQEDAIKISEKQEVKKLNKASELPPAPKKFNPFKDLKHEKPPTVKDEIKHIKDEIELEKFFKERQKEMINETLSSQEGSLLHEHANNILALPERNPYRRQIFANRLKQNTVIQEYLKENLVYNLMTRVNKHVRFGLHYGLEYNQSREEYEMLIKQLQLQQQKPPERMEEDNINIKKPEEDPERMVKEDEKKVMSTEKEDEKSKDDSSQEEIEETDENEEETESDED